MGALPCLALLDSSQFLRFPPEYSLSANGSWNVTLRCISKQLPLADARSNLEGDSENVKKESAASLFLPSSADSRVPS